MANLLIAGGAGYLGTVLVKLLLENNHFVRVLDRCFFGEASLDSFKTNPNFELLKCDIRWIPRETFNNIDVLIDVSGLSNDPSCALNPDLTLAINRDGSINLAKAAKESGVKQLIFSSSCSVYGSGDTLFLKEDSKCKPVSLYAKCKLIVEEALFNMCDKNFAVTVLRNGTFYGLSKRMRFDLLVNIMTARAFKDKKIFVVGGGEQWRPLVQVEDAATAFLKIINSKREKVAGEIFNVGSDDQNFRVITVANMINDIIPDAKLIKVPEDQDIRTYNVSFEKIKKVLDFVPAHNVPEAIIKIRDALAKGVVKFEGDKDEMTVTTERYINLTKFNPMLEEKDKHIIKRTVEFYKHNIDEKDILNVQQTLYSIFLTTGNITKKFETDLSEYLGVKRVIGTTSCTESLFLVLKALGITQDDEVITTPMSFVATANAIEHCGAKPVFIDVEEETGNIDANLIEDAITEKTKAILPVHLYGHMCDMKKISQIAKKHKLYLIEDCAHCVEGVRDDIRPGAVSDAACFSFYATKNITSGEGGAIGTNNEELANTLVKLRLHGLSADAATRYSGRFKQFDMELLGYKANMSNVDAALLIGQLSRIEELLSKRERIANRYYEGLSKIKNIRLPAILHNVKHSRHLFTIWVRADIRDEFIYKLQDKGIGVAVNYKPIHLMKYYAEKYGYKKGMFPVSERIGSETISIPFYPRLTDAEIDYIIESIKDIADEYN
ncbi:MAG: bifunctional SDR family oxidoreductase/aminotransferase class I/II-fold pyridoxal phosphate-dependent enzyme [Candidatus Hydrogenedentota bacterium]